MSLRERRLVLGVGGLAVALLVAVVISFAVKGGSAARGCVSAIFAGPVGAAQVQACGGDARRLCRQLAAEGYTGQARQSIAAACRRAGLPVD